MNDKENISHYILREIRTEVLQQRQSIKALLLILEKISIELENINNSINKLRDYGN